MCNLSKPRKTNQIAKYCVQMYVVKMERCDGCGLLIVQETSCEVTRGMNLP